jgi:hypothetical protein
MHGTIMIIYYSQNNHLSRKLRTSNREHDAPQQSNLQMLKLLLLKEVSAYTKQVANGYFLGA